MQGKATGLLRSSPGRRGLMLACAGLLLFSCRPPHSVTNPIPVDILLQEIDSAAACLQDLRGSARIATSFEDRAGRAALRMRYLSPARFRIDVHGTLFQVLAVLLIHDRRVRIYLPRENTVFEGVLGTSDARIPGLDLTLEDVRTGVTGSIEPGRYARMQIVDYQDRDGMVAVTLRDGDSLVSLRIDREKAAVIREVRTSSARGESVTRTFERLRKRNGLWRPGSVRIERRGSLSGTMELTYRTQSVNWGLRPADLDVRLPETVERRPLEEAAPVLGTMEEASVDGGTRDGLAP